MSIERSLTKERREKLKQLFRPNPLVRQFSEKDFPQVLPWEVGLLLNVPEYRTTENAKILEERLERQFMSVIKGLQDIKGMPDLRPIDWKIILAMFRTPGALDKEPKLKKEFEALLKNRVFAAGFFMADQLCNYAYVKAQKCAPQNEIETAYIVGLMESDGHVWKEVYKEGLAAERISKREMQVRLEQAERMVSLLPETARSRKRKKTQKEKGRKPQCQNLDAFLLGAWNKYSMDTKITVKGQRSRVDFFERKYWREMPAFKAHEAEFKKHILKHTRCSDKVHALEKAIWRAKDKKG